MMAPDLDIWVSRINALDSRGNELSWGSEVALIINALNTNHAVRTGALRYQRRAIYYDRFIANEERQQREMANLREVFPVVERMPPKTAWPLESGSTLINIEVHGNTNYYEKISTQYLRDNGVRSHFANINACQAGRLGGVVNSHILIEGSGNVLSMGLSDSIFPTFNLAYDKFRPTRELLAEGLGVGSALLFEFPTTFMYYLMFHGDLSIPMFPGGRVTPKRGDFNNDGVLDAADINALSAAIRQGDAQTAFDLNGDGQVSAEDRRVWVYDLKGTTFGNANFDLHFDSSDLIQVFKAGNPPRANASWEDGDWNGDGRFETDDLIFAFQHGGYQ